MNNQKAPDTGRYLERNGNLLTGAPMLKQVFSRWSAGLIVASSLAYYGIHHDDPKVFREMGKQAGLAALMSYGFRRVVKDHLSVTFNDNQVIDTKPVPVQNFTTHMKIGQAKADAYLTQAMLPPVIVYPMYAIGTIMLPFGVYALLPPVIEEIQSRKLVKNIAQGKWAVIDRSLMNKDTQSGPAL